MPQCFDTGREGSYVCVHFDCLVPGACPRLITAFLLYFITYNCFLCSSAGKESACNAGDLDSIPGLGRHPGEKKGYALQ